MGCCSRCLKSIVITSVHGIVIYVGAATDVEKCARTCKAHRACKWFTFDSEHQSCLLTKDKQFISDCPTCTYGNDQCVQEETSGMTLQGSNGVFAFALDSPLIL